jgi:hypothetical protein
MAAFDSIASVLSVAPQAVNLHLGRRHPFLWRIGAIEKVGVRSLDFTLEPRAQPAKIACQVLAEDPTSAPSPGLVAEANAPYRCAYFSNGGFILRVKPNVLAGLAQREIEMGWYNLTKQRPTSDLIANRGRLCLG